MYVPVSVNDMAQRIGSVNGSMPIKHQSISWTHDANNHDSMGESLGCNELI